MIDPSQKPTGTTYTLTGALVAVALIFSPAVLVVSGRPFGYWSVSLALACSALCLAVAWVSWKRSSQISIPSILNKERKAK